MSFGIVGDYGEQVKINWVMSEVYSISSVAGRRID